MLKKSCSVTGWFSEVGQDLMVGFRKVHQMCIDVVQYCPLMKSTCHQDQIPLHLQNRVCQYAEQRLRQQERPNLNLEPSWTNLHCSTLPAEQLVGQEWIEPVFLDDAQPWWGCRKDGHPYMLGEECAEDDVMQFRLTNNASQWSQAMAQHMNGETKGN